MSSFFLSQTGLSLSHLILLLFSQFSPCLYAPLFLRLTNDALLTLSFFEFLLLFFPYIYLKKKEESYKKQDENFKKTENSSNPEINQQKEDFQKKEKENLIQKNGFIINKKEINSSNYKTDEKKINREIANESEALSKRRIWKRAYFLADFDSRLPQTIIGTGLLLMFFFGMILVYAGVLEFKSSLISKLNLPMRFNMPYLLSLGVVFGVINPVVEEIYWRIFLRKTYKDNIFSLILINISYCSYHFFVVE